MIRSSVSFFFIQPAITLSTNNQIMSYKGKVLQHVTMIHNLKRLTGSTKARQGKAFDKHLRTAELTRPEDGHLW